MTSPCPSCGYCPTCGRRNYYPYTTQPYWNPPYTTTSGQLSNLINQYQASQQSTNSSYTLQNGCSCPPGDARHDEC